MLKRCRCLFSLFCFVLYPHITIQSGMLTVDIRRNVAGNQRNKITEILRYVFIFMLYKYCILAN